MRNQGITYGIFNNPVEGDRISITSKINGIDIVYNNSLSIIDFEFTNNDSEITSDPLHRVKIGSTKIDTLNNLRLFFESNGYFTSSFEINYIPTYGTVPLLDVFYRTEDIVSFSDNESNLNVSVGFFNDVIIETTKLKYFFEYKNNIGDIYRGEIYQKNFNDYPKEITGRAVLTKGEVKDHFDPIRGTGLSLSLEATEETTFEDLYSEGETDFEVRFFRNGAPIFYGFIKPDGITQSYTRSIWALNIECVDGLGFLNDLSFTKINGLQFTGKMSMLDIIYNCLKKTGLSFELNTFVDIEYEGMNTIGLSSNVLSQVYLSVDRFIKPDDNTIMSCAEVLTSILTIFSAVVTQQYGRWYVYRNSDFYFNDNPEAKTYDLNNAFKGVTSFLPKTKIGSQIDNIYPYHCNGNQSISIKGAVSAFRLGYKYGFIGSLLGNGNLNHQAGTKIYDKWTVDTWTENKNSGYLVIDPISTSGISFKSAVADIGETYDRQNALISVSSSELLEGYSIEFKTRFISSGFPVSIEFYVYLFPTDGTSPYTLNSDGTWNTLERTMLFRSGDFVNNTGELVDGSFERTFSVKSSPLPKKGTIQTGMFVPFKAFGSPSVLVEVKSIEIINTYEGNNVVGEFHTVSRSVSPSSIVKESKSVSVGDSISTVYEGAIYKNNQTDLTQFWHRKGFVESKPILRIAAEDNLRIAQRPSKLFSGDCFGFTPYLSLYSINKINGKFLPISWSFDTFTNISSVKLLELHSPELNSINYIKTEDFGETVKPTIVS